MHEGKDGGGCNDTSSILSRQCNLSTIERGLASMEVGCHGSIFNQPCVLFFIVCLLFKMLSRKEGRALEACVSLSQLPHSKVAGLLFFPFFLHSFFLFLLFLLFHFSFPFLSFSPPSSLSSSLEGSLPPSSSSPSFSFSSSSQPFLGPPPFSPSSVPQSLSLVHPHSCPSQTLPLPLFVYITPSPIRSF